MAAAPAAQIVVEVGFFSTASTVDGSMTWTDVSADVRAVHIDRGRQVELDEFEAGQAQIVLGNLAAKYDPANTAGPYFGNILPMRRVRVSVITDATQPEIFEGYVQGFEQAYQGTHDAITTLICADLFLVLNSNQLASGFYPSVIRAVPALRYWRLGEAAGNTVATDAMAGVTLTKVGAGAFGAAGLLSYDQDTAYANPAGIGANYLYAGGAGAGIFSTSPHNFAVTCIVKWDTTQAVGAAQWIILAQGAYSGNGLVLYVTSTNSLRVIVGNASGVLGTDYAQWVGTASSPNITDGNPHVVVVSYHDSLIGELDVYVDGVVQVAASFTNASVPLNGAGFSIGGAPAAAWPSNASWPGTLDEVALFPTTSLGSAAVLQQYGYARTPAAGDTTGARIGRVLDQIGWPLAKRSIDGGTVLLQAGALGQSALPYLQKVAESDQGLGVLFASRDGKVVFQDASHAFDHATPVITLTAANFQDVRLEYDDALIRNTVTVTREGGTPQTVVDATSVTNFLTHSFTLGGLMVADDGVALNVATMIAAAYANPAQRATSVTVNRRAAGLANNAAFDALLTADIGDVLRLQYTPRGGAAINQLYTIEGVEHTVTSGGKSWLITYRLAPAIFTLITMPVTWVYLNSHYATWSAISPRTWNALSL